MNPHYVVSEYFHAVSIHFHEIFVILYKDV